MVKKQVRDQSADMLALRQQAVTFCVFVSK